MERLIKNLPKATSIQRAEAGRKPRGWLQGPPVIATSVPISLPRCEELVLREEAPLKIPTSKRHDQDGSSHRGPRAPGEQGFSEGLLGGTKVKTFYNNPKMPFVFFTLILA